MRTINAARTFAYGAMLAALAGSGCGADRRGGSPGPDGGGDAGADAGADAGTDAGADAGADGGAGCVEGDYPPGPYAWSVGEVIGDTAFPAIFDGAVGALVLSELFCTPLQSLVFALGADD
jgi:hypothetical protein